MAANGAVPRGEIAPEHGLAEYLELLADVGREFATSLDLSATLQRALERIARYVGAEAASLFLLENDDRVLVCRACFGPVDVGGLRVAAAAGVVGRAVQSNACEMVRDVSIDPDHHRLVDERTGFTTRSILCAPLSVKDRRIGAIELVNKRGGDGLFSEDDRHLVQILASSAALAIINAKLTTALIEQEQLRRELDLAADIQRSLLPRDRAAGFPVQGVNVPARGVSGDFYDIFPLADGRVCFSIGDVSGKGMNAALLMAKTVSLYRCLGKTEHDPGRLLSMINAEICETATRGMFVTMVGGVYDPASGLVRFANAGHEPPLLHQPIGRWRSFPAQAPPLGIGVDLVPEAGYPVEECVLLGGWFAVFTDGVTEGRLDNGDALGVEGLKALTAVVDAAGPRARLDAVVERLGRPGAALRDDLTMLTIESRMEA